MVASISERDTVYQDFSETVTAGAEDYLKRVAKAGNLSLLPSGLKDHLLSRPTLLTE